MRSQRGQGTSAAGIPHSRLGEARRAVTQALIGRGKSVSGARSTHARHYAPLGAPRKLMMEVDKGAAVRVQGGGWGGVSRSLSSLFLGDTPPQKHPRKPKFEEPPTPRERPGGRGGGVRAWPNPGFSSGA